MSARLLVSLLAGDQEFQRLQADDARTAAARSGLTVDIVFAESSAILQIQQLYKAIHRPAEERPRAIIVETVVGEGLERVARAATQAGIGWVLINRRVSYLEDLRRRHPELPISSVGTDQVEIGRIQARQFRALVPSGEALVLYLQGPPDTSVARERLQGAQEGLSGSGIQLRVLDGDWTELGGGKAVESWLRLRTSEGVRPDLVGSQNDAMAVGARRVLQRAGARPELARLRFTGCDGLVDGGQRLVGTGELAATVITPSNTGPAVDLVARALRSKSSPPAEMVLPPISYPPLDVLLLRQAGRGPTPRAEV